MIMFSPALIGPDQKHCCNHNSYKPLSLLNMDCINFTKDAAIKDGSLESSAETFKASEPGSK